MPRRSKLIRKLSYDFERAPGKIPERIFEPSSGGKGIKLKSASKRLIYTISTNNSVVGSPGSYADKDAENKCEKDINGRPCPATSVSSYLPGRLYGL